MLAALGGHDKEPFGLGSVFHDTGKRFSVNLRWLSGASEGPDYWMEAFLNEFKSPVLDLRVWWKKQISKYG